VGVLAALALVGGALWYEARDRGAAGGLAGGAAESFVGDWTAHSTLLTVEDDGDATLAYRDYSQPGMVDLTIDFEAQGTQGDTLRLEVVRADDGAGMEVGDIANLELGAPGVHLSGGDLDLDLCDQDHQMQGDCGA
jgi:hypothetical protein